MSPRGRFCLRGIALLCALVVVEAPIRAVFAEDIEAIFKRGTDLRKEGRDAEALVQFQRAARIQDSPRANAQVGIAEQALGSWVDAHVHLSKAIASRTDPWIEKNRAALEQAMEVIESHLGQLEVWGAPGGAEVLLDDKPIGNLPNVSVWVDPGELSLRVRASGFADVTRVVKLRAEAHVREHIDLRSKANPGTPQAAVTVSSDTVGRPPPDHVEPPLIKQADPSPTTDDGETPIHQQWWFWTLVGVGIVAAGGTAWYLTHRSTKPDTCTAPCTDW